jgi:hypothetical protein
MSGFDGAPVPHRRVNAVRSDRHETDVGHESVTDFFHETPDDRIARKVDCLARHRDDVTQTRGGVSRRYWNDARVANHELSPRSHRVNGPARDHLDPPRHASRRKDRNVPRNRPQVTAVDMIEVRVRDEHGIDVEAFLS